MNSVDPLDVREQQRLEALWALRVLDTAPEPRFDRMTRLAADLFDVPAALVSLIDRDRQWFKSRHGFDACETDRKVAFCDHAIRLPAQSVMVVPDATLDARFADNPNVTNGMVRFYAGAVLSDTAGHNLGTLCVFDDKPRVDFGEAESKRLRELADMVAEQLELTRERLVAEEHRQLLELAEAVADMGHWRWPIDSGAIAWSNEMFHIFGVAPDYPLDANTIRALHAPEDRDDLDAFIEKAIAGKVQEIELSIVRPDGERRVILTRAMRETGANGELVALFGVVQDITDRHAATQRLTESEAALRAALSRAEEASEAKSRFLSNISHELRTPLTSIIGFSTVLKTTEGLDPVQKRCADRINTSGKALLTVINDVLDYSKLEAGGMVIKSEPFGLSPLLAEVAEIMLGQIEAKKLWYEVKVAPEVPETLVGDASRVRQILLNLVSNAVKFTDTGGITLDIRRLDRSERSIIRFDVTDTGIGIDPEDGKRLFERFFQADSGPARRHGGTGLGLSICRELTKLMGGTMGVESTAGAGSTFWFELPLENVDA